MSVILVLIGASLFVAIGFLGAFIWAVRSGQYEDKYTPSVRMLFDDEIHIPKIERNEINKSESGNFNKFSEAVDREKLENEKSKILK